MRAIVSVLMFAILVLIAVADDPIPRHWDNLGLHEAISKLSTRRIRKAQTHFNEKRPALHQQVQPSPEACNTCEMLVGVAIGVLTDSNLSNFTHDVASAACKRVTNTTAGDAICDAVADIALFAAFHAFTELDKLHWNIPVSVCADILQLCIIPCCLSNSTAEQLHIHFDSPNPVSNSTSITVNWIMQNYYPDAMVAYRRTGDTTWMYSESVSAASYRIGGWVGNSYSSGLWLLAADTEYEYTIVRNVTSVSETYKFRTLPLNVGTPERPMRILSLADMGYHAVSDATVAAMTELVDAGKVDFVLHYGDLGYADGNEADWDRFFRKIEPIAARVPYMTTPGNHECLWNFTVYRARLTMMVPENQPSDAMYYSFTVGHVKFVMMDTESWINTPQVKDNQLQWLIGDLQSSAGLFKVVTMHRPLYCTTPGADCNMWAGLLRSRLEDIFDSHDVSIIKAGHLHNYERTYPVEGNTLQTMNLTNPTTPMYIVNGAAGNKEGQVDFPASTLKPWSAFRTPAVGFMTMEISTAGTTTTVRGNFIQASDKQVLDSFVLHKDN